jgi:hypothetical protein
MVDAPGRGFNGRAQGDCADRTDPAAVIVFLGPTLCRPDAAELIEAVFRPPARRGDIHRALHEQCRTIVLIDGEFHGRPSVWQREILDALAEGVAVHGSSSMGALRAAELHSFGMVGHGRIFEWYRDGVIDADDEVALTYGPAELGYPPLSEPLVNIRATLAAAVPAIISAEERDCLIAHAKALYFPERSFARLLGGAPAAVWSADRRAAVASFLRHSRIDLKRCDAIAALRSVAAGANGAASRSSNALANALWRRERLVAEGLVPSIAATDPAAVARQVGLDSEALHGLRRELSELFFVAAWARTRGIIAAEEDFALARREVAPTASLSRRRIDLLLEVRATAAAAARVLAANGGARDPKATRRAIILDWANANGIEHASLDGDALVDWIITQGPNQFGYIWPFGVELLETLQLRGRIAPARARCVS